MNIFEDNCPFASVVPHPFPACGGVQVHTYLLYLFTAQLTNNTHDILTGWSWKCQEYFQVVSYSNLDNVKEPVILTIIAVFHIINIGMFYSAYSVT